MSDVTMTQRVVRVIPNVRKSDYAGCGMNEKGRSVLLIKLGANLTFGIRRLRLQRLRLEAFTFGGLWLGVLRSVVTAL
ncbi:hypothetical protein WJU23_07830 [Prosthecobacter sp. SYSU 5D2]|uniref:hypothetical protein n=1 Tax=Prosthecobacter sp. SYSU 5D2 TaxID=3134134 RepID=UPI0031FE7249